MWHDWWCRNSLQVACTIATALNVSVSLLSLLHARLMTGVFDVAIHRTSTLQRSRTLWQCQKGGCWRCAWTGVSPKIFRALSDLAMDWPETEPKTGPVWTLLRATEMETGITLSSTWGRTLVPFTLSFTTTKNFNITKLHAGFPKPVQSSHGLAWNRTKNWTGLNSTKSYRNGNWHHPVKHSEEDFTFYPFY